MIAITEASFYIGAAWIVTFSSVAVYAAWVIRRGKQLSKQVPPEDRRWM